jgi:hypothetical protein
MSDIRIEQHAEGVRVTGPGWQVEHSAAAGGAWNSVTLSQGAGRNLLRAPLASAIRFAGADAGSLAAFGEQNERAPRLRVETAADGTPAVVAEGTYRDQAGNAIPVGYRRRTEYHADGLIWTTLVIMSDAGCDGVVEVRALEVPLGAGMSECFVRFHPTQAGGPDLLGASARYELGGGERRAVFASRFTPLQVLCRNGNGEALEFFPSPELAQWDTAIKPDAGLGFYGVEHDRDGTTVMLAPYCMAFRRAGTRLQGVVTLRLGIVLPIASGRPAIRPEQIARVDGRWLSDADLAGLARRGVNVLCYRDDYRDAGTDELKQRIDAAHRNGLKIVPYVSLKALHPAVPAYREHADEWLHMAARSVGPIHDWAGAGERGVLMCLKSGWYDCCAQRFAALLADLPWDGLYCAHATPYPCCHPGHAKGPYHSDLLGVLSLLRHCRGLVGADRLLLISTERMPSVLAENIADAVFIA